MTNTMIARCGLMFLLLGSTSLAQGIDDAIAHLSADISAMPPKSNVKKLSVLDFSDLEGGGSELGRYIAEQLSISLATSSKEFSVMNRANLRSILEEHKLTASGLVNPENAKQLGKFSGVDAIVMGTITPFGDNFVITAQLLSTETAQILGGAKAQVPRSSELNGLWGVSRDARAVGSQTGFAPANAQEFTARSRICAFDDIAVEILSFRTTDKGIKIVLGLTCKHPSGEALFVINRDARQDVKVDVSDESGAFGQIASASGIRSLDVGYYADSFKYLSQHKNDAQFVQRMLPMFGKAVAARPSIATIELTRSGEAPGSVFRFDMELITAVRRGSSLELKLNNVFIDDIRPAAK